MLICPLREEAERKQLKTIAPFWTSNQISEQRIARGLVKIASCHDSVGPELFSLRLAQPAGVSPFSRELHFFNFNAIASASRNETCITTGINTRPVPINRCRRSSRTNSSQGTQLAEFKGPLLRSVSRVPRAIPFRGENLFIAEIAFVTRFFYWNGECQRWQFLSSGFPYRLAILNARSVPLNRFHGLSWERKKKAT